MAYPTPSFAALTGTQPLSLFDAMFAQVAAMVSIPCTASGSANAIVITPTGNAPSLAAYATGNFFNFKAVGNSSSAVTIQFMALAALPLYFADGTTQVTTQIVSGRNYIVGFDAALNSGNGAYYLPMPQMPGTVGQVLTMAASGPAYAAPANSAVVLLNTLTASNSATLEDITNITATYSVYEFVLVDLFPITATTTLVFRVRSGGVFQVSGYAGVGFEAASGGGTSAGSAGSVAVNLTDSGWTNLATAGAGVAGSFRLYNPAGTSAAKKIIGQTGWFNSSSADYRLYNFHANWAGGTGAIDGVQFVAASGNISSGSVKIYGIA